MTSKFKNPWPVPEGIQSPLSVISYTKYKVLGGGKSHASAEGEAE